MFKKFNTQEIEKLKKEKDLVWYEIPELNIKFLVKRDTKKDLGYTISKLKDEFGKDNIGIRFYSRAEVNYKNEKLGYRCFDEKSELGSACSRDIFISKISVESNEGMKDVKKFFCEKDKNGDGQTLLLKQKNNYYICAMIDHQSFNWRNRKEYEEFLKETTKNSVNNEAKKNKEPSMYFGTIQPIK